MRHQQGQVQRDNVGCDAGQDGVGPAKDPGYCGGSTGDDPKPSQVGGSVEGTGPGIVTRGWKPHCHRGLWWDGLRGVGVVRT